MRLCLKQVKKAGSAGRFHVCVCVCVFMYCWGLACWRWCCWPGLRSTAGYSSGCAYPEWLEHRGRMKWTKGWNRLVLHPYSDHHAKKQLQNHKQVQTDTVYQMKPSCGRMMWGLRWSGWIDNTHVPAVVYLPQLRSWSLLADYCSLYNYNYL